MKSNSSSSVPHRNAISRCLLASLFVSLSLVPLFEGLSVGRPILLVGLTITFVIGARAANRKSRLFLTTLLVVALPASWATLFLDWTWLLVTHCLLGSIFFWVLASGIAFTAMRSRRISFESVYDASSAYLLFGLAWALSYWSIHSLEPQAFSFPDPTQPGFSDFVYYSFVTMSTLGYGDITPLERVTRTLSWIQSITGQFYVAVIIAWLVSALPRPGSEEC